MSRLPVGMALAAMIVGCGGAPPPTPVIDSLMPPASEVPTPSPTERATYAPTLAPGPTPTFLPLPVPTHFPTQEELYAALGPLAAKVAAACEEVPVPRAARYAGKVHPLVVAYQGADRYYVYQRPYAVNTTWFDDGGKTPLQLVICLDDEETADAESCGIYTRTDGVRGELFRSRMEQRVRVIVAKTGKLLQVKFLYGADPGCSDLYSGTSSDYPVSDPPWHVVGPPVSQAQIEQYAETVSKQKVK